MSANPDPIPRRILALDGGGLRIFYTVEVLERVEALVRERLGRQDAVLSDYFQLIAGTSAGAILGALIAWGMSVAEIKILYQKAAVTMFEKNKGLLAFVTHRYSAVSLSKMLHEIFLEEDGSEALLGTGKLRAFLLIVMRNATTGSAWPLCNHPSLKFNDRALSDCNLNIPLWRIVRASTAAPTFFEPERIPVGNQIFQFVDGGVTPYNNPALIAALMATERCYGINWPRGEEQLYVLSVGTGRTRVFYSEGMWNSSLPIVAGKSITSLIEGATQQQDLLCRIFGRCLYGPTIDSEIGDLIESEAGDSLNPPGGKRFSYVRYNSDFQDPELGDTLIRYGGDVPMDLPHLIPAFQSVGKKYAESQIKMEHLR